MPKEIERQYVVNTEHPEWITLVPTLPYKYYVQTTIHRGNDNKFRVRLIEDPVTGEKTAAFTFKVNKKTTRGGPNIRDEYEWEVPYRVALYIMIGHGEVRKTRYSYTHTDGKIWEFDAYQWANTGIVLADVELSSADEKIQIPKFIWQETTREKRITNNSFTLHPYVNWSTEEKSWYESLKQRK